jgi:hypothetical protein
MSKSHSHKNTQAWLGKHSITEAVFDSSSIDLLRAQITAKNILRSYPHLITAQHAALLLVFCEDFAHAQQRKHITQHQILQVLNIGSKLRRQLFKQQKLFM